MVVLQFAAVRRWQQSDTLKIHPGDFLTAVEDGQHLGKAILSDPDDWTSDPVQLVGFSRSAWTGQNTTDARLIGLTSGATARFLSPGYPLGQVGTILTLPWLVNGTFQEGETISTVNGAASCTMAGLPISNAGPAHWIIDIPGVTKAQAASTLATLRELDQVGEDIVAFRVKAVSRTLLPVGKRDTLLSTGRISVTAQNVLDAIIDRLTS